MHLVSAFKSMLPYVNLQVVDILIYKGREELEVGASGFVGTAEAKILLW